MPFQLELRESPDHLHAIVTGANTLENVPGYLEQLRREREKRDCRRVLIEEKLTGRRLETRDVYQIASRQSGNARGFFEAVAFVRRADDGFPERRGS